MKVLGRGLRGFKEGVLTGEFRACLYNGSSFFFFPFLFSSGLIGAQYVYRSGNV